MPGGADVNFCNQLNGEGNQIIKDFVFDGGSYLGICAGAYYACRDISWAKDSPNEIIGNRELSFFDCTAVGPVNDFIEDGDPAKCWSQAARIAYESDTIPSLYLGGPVFTGVPDSQVLARFSDLPGFPPAIVGRTYGKGKVVLTSPHLEYDSVSFANAFSERSIYSSWQKAVAEKLVKHDESQGKAWKWLMGYALPPVYRESKPLGPMQCKRNGPYLPQPR